MTTMAFAVWPNGMPTLRQKWITLILLAALLFAAASPAIAHKEHKKKKEVAEQVAPPAPQAPGMAAPGVERGSMNSRVSEAMLGKADRSKTAFERLLDWLGRLHPVIVHFPIAFFPAALFAAIVGRRRPAFARPVPFLVIAGGIIAPIAALLGWFDAIGADPDPLLAVHRWLGTAIGIGGLGLALVAWRRPEEDRGRGTIIGLTAITAAILVQGWYGGAMVHGMDHMNW